MYDVILWDVDGTLLDFVAAERAAIKATFKEFGLKECTDEMHTRYSAINAKYWKRLEQGRLTKPEVLRGRFVEFFSEEGIDLSVIDEFNGIYQERLGDTVVFNDDAYEIIKSLKGRVRQYAVTNGTLTAQRKKLEKSGLKGLFDGGFISEEVGFEKPSAGFFAKVFESIGKNLNKRAIIVGDSLLGDILGGKNAGISTCLYNPKDEKNLTDILPDFEIRDLHEIFNIIF